MNSSFIKFLASLLITSCFISSVLGQDPEVPEVVQASDFVPNYANYGEPCSKVTDCDSGAYLTCVNGSCQCALGDAMRFDDASSSCWVLPGEKCIYRASQIGLEGVLADIAGLEERTAHLADRVSFRCVSNAACEDGNCMCDASFYKTANGTCERRKEKGEDCQTSPECR